MNILLIALGVVTLVQLFTCHVSLWLLISLILRVLFSLRVVGLTVKTKTLCIAEGINWLAMLLYNYIFHKGNMPWLRIVIFLLCLCVSCIIMFLDELFYVYVTEDEMEE